MTMVPDDIRVPPGAKPPVGRPPKHGAYSGSALVPVTNEKLALIRKVLEGTAVNIGPSDKIALDMLARNLAKIELIDRWLAVNGLFGGDSGNEPQPILRIYWQATNAAMRLCVELGLTPQSRVRLGIGMAQAQDMAEEMQKAKEREHAV